MSEISNVYSFDNIVNARDFGARFLHPHVAEGVGQAAVGTFPLLDRDSPAPLSIQLMPPTSPARIEYMQISHLQEAVRQNESESYFLDAGPAVCPPESEAATHVDQTRQQLVATDNIVKISLDVYAAIWEHGRAVPAVNQQNRTYNPTVQNQQNRTYNPTPGRHTAAAQTTELFIQKSSSPMPATTSLLELHPPLHPASGGDASAATNPTPAGRGGPAANDHQ
jgi:hypothetical protein